jgi:hypothetical protein
MISILSFILLSCYPVKKHVVVHMLLNTTTDLRIKRIQRKNPFHSPIRCSALKYLTSSEPLHPVKKHCVFADKFRSLTPRLCVFSIGQQQP